MSNSCIISFRMLKPILLCLYATLMLAFFSCSEKMAKEIRTYENGALQTIEYLDIHGNIVERLRISGENKY
jgi:hypothetical protein